MPQQQNTISTGTVTLTTSPLPIANCTGVYLYVSTDGNGGGNSSGTDQCGITTLQAFGPVSQYQDSGLHVHSSSGLKKIGYTTPLGTQNLRVYKNGVTYGIPLLATSTGSTDIKISKNNVTYYLPDATYAPTENITALNTYNWSTTGPGGPYTGSWGWNYGNGGGSFYGQLTNIFSQPYTVTSIVYNLYLFARGYGDDWQTANCTWNLYYTLNYGSSWVQITGQSVGPG